MLMVLWLELMEWRKGLLQLWYVTASALVFEMKCCTNYLRTWLTPNSQAAGGRPVSLNEQEGCAFDVATVLTRGGVLPLGVYKHALGVFGQDGVSELINLVGLYSLVSVTLNGFNVTVPIEDEA